MKKAGFALVVSALISVGPARAADLPSLAAPLVIPPAAPASWTGFHVGVNVGGA